MNPPEQVGFDFEAARAARDEGIRRAVDHADRVSPKWSDAAFAFLQGFARAQESFTTEEVRAASAGIVPDPPDPRAWGGVAARAARAGLIERLGFEAARNPKVHCGTITRWRSRVHG